MSKLLPAAHRSTDLPSYMAWLGKRGSQLIWLDQLADGPLTLLVSSIGISSSVMVNFKHASIACRGVVIAA